MYGPLLIGVVEEPGLRSWYLLQLLFRIGRLHSTEDLNMVVVLLDNEPWAHGSFDVEVLLSLLHELKELVVSISIMEKKVSYLHKFLRILDIDIKLPHRVLLYDLRGTTPFQNKESTFRLKSQVPRLLRLYANRKDVCTDLTFCTIAKPT